MPTTLTHAVVGLGIAGLAPGAKEPGFWVLSVALAELPDIDVLAFRLGIPYGAPHGHRGLVHSFAFALIASLPLAFVAQALTEYPYALACAYCFCQIAVHDTLDALTNGGKGLALFAPFTHRRFFFPWQPIQVSPIGLAVFSAWGLRALLSEVVWVWLPLACLLALKWLSA